MITENFNMTTEIVASEDGKYTYEIKRTVENGNTGKAIVVELYPTIHVENKESLDLSTMHLMNHVKELGFGEIRIINLFSQVFNGKPMASRLTVDIENLAYIEEMLAEPNIDEYTILICYGSTLSNNSAAKEMKRELLTMIRDSGLSENVKQISVDYLETNEGVCPHPLFLGLRHARDEWSLADFDIDELLQKLEPKPEAEKPKKKAGRKKKAKTAENKKDENQTAEVSNDENEPTEQETEVETGEEVSEQQDENS